MDNIETDRVYFFDNLNFGYILFLINILNMKYHLFGDSHIMGIWHPDIIKHRFKASSAMGLINNNSKSNSKERFLRIYSKNSKERVLMKFGQVDTDFVYFIKLTQESISFEQFANNSIDKYFRFILEFMEPEMVTILSVYPPFLDDSCVKEGITKIHFMDKQFKKKLQQKLKLIDIPNINERIKFNKLYNDILKKKCHQYNLKFIDLFSILCDEYQHPLYLNDDGNHHLNNQYGWERVNQVISDFIQTN